MLRDAVGSMADWLRQLAAGIDDRPVVAHRDTKSSGSETTYPEDLTDLETIRREIVGDGSTCHPAGWQRKDLLARTVTIKVRYSDFHDVTRSHTARADAGRCGYLRQSVDVTGQNGGRATTGPPPGRQRSQSLYTVDDRTQLDNLLPFTIVMRPDGPLIALLRVRES